MKSVPPDSELFIPFIRKRIEKSCLIQRLVPRRIRNNSLNGMRQEILADFDPHDICRHMNRAQRDNSFQIRKDIRSNNNRLFNPLSSVKNPVPDSIYLLKT